MKTNIVDHGDAKAVRLGDRMKMRLKWTTLLLACLSVVIGAAGCDGYYAGYPGYGPYYGSPPYYGGGAGSVVVEAGDRPYYTHGPGYYVGRTYYVWRPGHWRWRGGQRVWIRGHYVIRR
jgi:YXWGXW repeat-containing protein